ncbi:MAG: hypothetical protein JO112_00015, partial [Planctomycetes bacterium]|nr:hypothetical protein [Planctomycetota bacterium]
MFEDASYLEKPPPDVWEDRPWERPGAIRRDCQVHRGGLIYLLGAGSFLLGLGAIFAGGTTALMGLPLGLVACTLGRRDLREMSAGLMDPAGRIWTATGKQLGFVGIGFNLFWGIIWGILWAVAYFPRY